MATVVAEDLLAGSARRKAAGPRQEGTEVAPGVADVAAMSLERFARAGLVLRVRSTLFDEVVLFASDNARVPADEQRPVYRAADLDRLLRRRGERI